MGSPFGDDLFGNPVQPKGQGELERQFIMPPFTVLDGRAGNWLECKRAWVALGIEGSKGRGEGGKVFETDPMRGGLDYFGGKDDDVEAGTSIFDPVLCELAYRWWCPPGGHVLDPFAGEATKGLVAAHLGYSYTGIELRQEQIDENNAQAERLRLNPCWVQGDSSKLDELLDVRDGMYDLIFTSPPYYNLEEYGGGDADASMAQTYAQFMEVYEKVFADAVYLLRANRFVVVKVGEIRDEKGFYRNFVGDNVACFERLGCRYYNEAVLITPVGSLAVRAGRQFNAYRKLGKGHQNILVFFKGNSLAAVKKRFGEVQDAQD